jgi:hypothetical protein
MILGTFHFAQSGDIDVLEAGRQRELDEVLRALEAFRPDRIAVEFPRVRAGELQERYDAYLATSTEPDSPNEIYQIGFRLGERLGHAQVHAVDVPMNLWHDSIQVFDDTYPASRESLRARWPARFEPGAAADSHASLTDILVELNEDDPPGNSEMYGGFLPLVEADLYAGALKLRPWYDRNLRIVQNLFRIADPADDRILLVIGAGHLRVLKQMMEMTPQLCPVSALDYLGGP